MEQARLQHFRQILAERLAVATAVAARRQGGPGTHDRQVVEDITAALDRISEGSFGTCLTCAAALSEHRLAVRPATRSCERCSRETHRRD